MRTWKEQDPADGLFSRSRERHSSRRGGRRSDRQSGWSVLSGPALENDRGGRGRRPDRHPLRPVEALAGRSPKGPAELSHQFFVHTRVGLMGVRPWTRGVPATPAEDHLQQAFSADLRDQSSGMEQPEERRAHSRTARQPRRGARPSSHACDAFGGSRVARAVRDGWPLRAVRCRRGERNPRVVGQEASAGLSLAWRVMLDAIAGL